MSDPLDFRGTQSYHKVFSVTEVPIFDPKVLSKSKLADRRMLFLGSTLCLIAPCFGLETSVMDRTNPYKTAQRPDFGRVRLSRSPDFARHVGTSHPAFQLYTYTGFTIETS